MLSHSNHKNLAKMVGALRNYKGNLIIIMEHFKEGNLMEKRMLEVEDGYFYQE